MATIAATIWIGGIGPESTLSLPQQVAVLGTLGGITSMLQGGKFGHGFVSAGLSAIGGEFIKGASWIKKGVGKTVARITLGGTISTVTGGKFANGAAGAAFSMMVSSLKGLAGEGAKTVKEKSNAAALEKLDKYNPKSVKENQEYAGLLYQTEGGIVGATDAIAGTGCDIPGACSNPWDAEHLLPDDATVIGDYHTHGANSSRISADDYGTSMFSSGDVLRVDVEAKAIPSFRGSYMANSSGDVYFYSAEHQSPSMVLPGYISPIFIETNSEYIGNISR